MSRRNRREFVRESAALTAAVAALGGGNTSHADEQAVRYASQWDHTPDRTWIGPEYWATAAADNTESIEVVL